MRKVSEGVLLRVFIGDSDRSGGKPLYQVLVERARVMGLAGATVLHGPMGFGRHSRVHKAGLVDLSADLPIVIEFVDSEERINGFLDQVDTLVVEGLVTLEKVKIVDYEGSS